MSRRVRDVMTSNSRTIDTDNSIAYAPIVEGEKLVAAEKGRDPDQIKVDDDVASTRLITSDWRQDLEEALRIMAKHQRLVRVVAHADIAREGGDSQTGQLVEEISK